MKKILFIVNGISTGGAEKVVVLLANSLSKINYDVTILAFCKANHSYDVSKDVKILYANNNNSCFIDKLNRIRNIRNTIIKNNIDVVVAFSTHFVLSSIIANFKVNKKLIGSERNDPSKVKNIFIKIARDILYKKLDYLVCQTYDAKKYFSKHIQRKSIVIKNPLSNKLPERYEGKRENRIVSFSRFEPQKNITMLIDAFEIFHKEFDNYTLELYGDGSEKSKIIDYVKEKNLMDCIKISPFCIDIHERVLKAKMFVLASNYEGLSNSMIEAMAIGLPTICTDCPCGGARMMIKNGVNGLLVKVGDTIELYEKMKLIATDNELCNLLSINATKIKTELAEDEIINKWVNIINN